MPRKEVLAFCLLCLLVILITSCNNPAVFGIKAEQEVFYQSDSIFSNKVDVLWVIDNSGSMTSSQQNLANNFDHFIDQFLSRNLDFQMAVITTDAYQEFFSNDLADSQFRDGTDETQHTGYFILTNRTPNLKQVFLTNMLQGINGLPDERPLQSIRQALINPLNAGFLRPRGFLAIIIVSDEDDFSHDGVDSISGKYNDPGIHKIDQYIDFFDSLTFSEPTNRYYSINTIAIPDRECLDILQQNSQGQKIGHRIMEISVRTEGIQGNLCADFATTLHAISGRILSLATQFRLEFPAQVDTIRVNINGENVPLSPIDGWTYNPTNNSIMFHGSAVPPQGAKIIVDYTPADIK